MQDDQKPRVSRRGALKTGAIATGALATNGFIGAAGAKPGKGSNGKCDISVPDDYATIQAAVDAANEEGTICVGDGTYTEQVEINKSVTLKAAAGATPTIKLPDSATEYTIPESESKSWEPVAFAFGGTADDSNEISGAESVDVTLKGFTIDGAGHSEAGTRVPGILFRNANGEIRDCTVDNMAIGGGETFGIQAYGDSEITIAGNEVNGAERGGIGGNGDGGEHPAPDLTIKNNSVTCSAGVGEAWASNGIQIGFGATGKIRGNTVNDNRHGGEDEDGSSGDWVAAGILVFESEEVQVLDNAIKNSDVGVGIGSWGWFTGSADGNKVTKNTIDDASVGVQLQAVAWEGYSQDTPSVSDTKVVNNEVTDEDEGGDIGVHIGAVDADPEDGDDDPDFDPVVENNKVINNKITGFTTNVEDGGDETKIHAIKP